jgi:hypothetical protein
MSAPSSPTRSPRPWRLLWWGAWSGAGFGVAWAVIDFALSTDAAGVRGGVLSGWLLIPVLAAAVPWTRARGLGMLRARHGWVVPLVASLLAVAVFVVVALTGLVTLVSMAVTGGGN